MVSAWLTEAGPRPYSVSKHNRCSPWTGLVRGDSKAVGDGPCDHSKASRSLAPEEIGWKHVPLKGYSPSGGETPTGKESKPSVGVAGPGSVELHHDSFGQWESGLIGCL